MNALVCMSLVIVRFFCYYVKGSLTTFSKHNIWYEYDDVFLRSRQGLILFCRWNIVVVAYRSFCSSVKCLFGLTPLINKNDLLFEKEQHIKIIRRAFSNDAAKETILGIFFTFVFLTYKMVIVSSV